MLKQSIIKEGILFSVSYNSKNLIFNEWKNTDDCIYYLPLSTLVDNGNATVYTDGCLVPFDNIYLLDQEEKSLLGIPNLYEKCVRIKGTSMLNMQDFKYKVEFLTHIPDGDLINFDIKGNILENDEDSYLLSEAQYKLLKRINEFNCIPNEKKKTDFNLRHFAEIKTLADEAGCTLDNYLNNENVYAPELIKIEIGKDNNGFTIDPAINIPENKKFQEYFNKYYKVLNTYPISRENGERVRIVLDEEQQENLSVIKNNGGRYKTKEEIKDIIEHPTEYFNPDIFDLSNLYSDRVMEIGLYKPKYFPFISPYKSEWIVGAIVETPIDGTSHIIINTKDELENLKNSINNAKDNQKDIVDFKGTQLSITDAEHLAKLAEEQLKDTSVPLKIENQNKVLIIKDNSEILDFKVNVNILEDTNKYTLSTNPFLNNKYSLKGHQKEGIAWLQFLYRNNASGSLIADDMGLGKTLQVLYFIDWHARNNPNHKPYLIVTPVSILENWKAEYERYFTAPLMNISILTKKDVPRKYSKDIVDDLQKRDIILTSYESLRNSQLNFCAVEFDIVVLDEAQKIKTPGNLVTNAAKALKGNFKIAMTGTPVENTLLDLWCIMDFCVPGLLGNAKSFAAKYQNPLKDNDADVIEIGNKIHNQLGRFFIRRLKKDVAKDLPQKIEIKEKVQMPIVQNKTYEYVINKYNNAPKREILATIMQLREVSEHPYLFSSTLNNRESAEIIETSARLQATIKYLDEIKQKNEKVIIFAERKDIQNMIQKICLDKYNLYCTIINGDTPSCNKKSPFNKETRQKSIDKFQSIPGFNIIIMSPIAAGMGLNVTAANHVIHYSRHWNPAKENQATDRAYRIGQNKDVFVYYPMAIRANNVSFDETLDNLLSRKTTLATSTIFPTERIEVKPEELSQILFKV